MTPWQLRRARAVLDHSGVIAYPTEAVFGLGCRPLDPIAVYRLLDIKHRPPQLGLIVIAADVEQLEPFLHPVAANLRRRAYSSWPGPHTWLWPARPGTPDWLTGSHDTLAVRVSSHPVVRALCMACGPLVSTSANRHGQPAARSALDAQRALGSNIDLVIHGNTGNLARPTSIRDLLSNRTIRAA